MSFMNGNGQIKDLYDYAIKTGLTGNSCFSADNVGQYIETSIDAYSTYPLFLYIFGGNYNAKTLTRMMEVDFKSRLGTMAGLAGEGFESVVMLEPPLTPRTGLLQYVKVAHPGDYSLLVKPAKYRLEDFERYALEKRKPYLDDKTWYMYLFATKQEFQGKGYGKKLLDTLVGFAKERGFRLCLETNLDSNVGLYEHFGFRVMDSFRYKDAMDHFVMLYS